MSDQDFAIYQRLLNNPGMLHVATDKSRVYALDDAKKMYVLTIDALASKTEAEINQIVCAMVGNC